MSSRSQAQQEAQKSAQKVLEHELALAERRGADRLRDEILAVLEDRRRIVRMGDHQIEVVELSALAELLDDEDDAE